MSPTARQWLSLVGVIWLQSINGTNSNFPAYSSQLKELLSLSQIQLNNLASASDAGKLFGWLSGIASVYLPLWLVLLIGSLLGLTGYGVQYLFLTHQIPSLSYWQIFLLTVVAGNSICWINTVCYLVIVKNFPLQRQAAAGLTTSYVGLSAAIYTAIADALSSPTTKKAEQYLLLNSVSPAVVSVITASLVGVTASIGSEIKASASTESGFVVVATITVATGIYAIVSNLGVLSSKKQLLSPSVEVIGFGLCLALLLVVPAAEFLRSTLENKYSIKRERRVCDESARNSEGAEGFDESGTTKDVDVGAPAAHHELVAMEEIRAKLMLKRLNFWLYFIVYISGATLGLVYLNNLGQIAESRGYAKTSTLVSFSSAFGFFGRLLPCLLHYIYSSRKYMVPGPASIVAMMVPMSGAFFLLLNGTDLTLYISTAVIGFCTGAITTISVSMTTELFGAKSFGVNHNVLVANIPIGSFLFGNLAALLYHVEGNGLGKCMGLECYAKTFFTWGCLCTLGTLLAFWLYLRTRSFYLHRV